MKQKQNELIVKIAIFLFALSIGLLGNVFAQYYYFASSGEYQQGCNEVLEVRVNSKGQNVTAGRFHLVLDPVTTLYPYTSDVAELRSFFVPGSAFTKRTSDKTPSWKPGSNTILQVDRNTLTQYNGTSGLYANVNFIPVFSGGTYNVEFAMEYTPDDSTIETTLSPDGGGELINSGEQIDHMTGIFAVLQKPCEADTKIPTISNISFGSTKVSHLSGLTFWLKDGGGVSGTGVPYVFLSGAGEWTGNKWGISNQYGVDPSAFELILSGATIKKTIKNTTPGVRISWSGDAWNGNKLDAYFEIDPECLFDFGIEEEIKATFKFSDRAGNFGTQTIYFNTPKGPELVSNSAVPGNGNRYVKLNAPITLGIKDDWAGVNSGTIKVTLSGVNGTDYGPYIFSGADLNLSGVQRAANSPDYDINISNHEAFPTSGTIKVSVYAKDMEGNVDTIYDYIFYTRPNCSEFQCCDPVLLDLGDGDPQDYDNTGLIISGGNPVLTIDAENITGTIDCNMEDEGLSIYDSQNNLFFTDESILTILGTGVKGVLSGDVLTLRYIIEDSQIIIDKPIESEFLSGESVDIQWHLTGSENQDDWLSGYVVEIIGDDFVTGGFVDGTGITDNLPDGEYEIVIYPVDVLGNTGNITTGSFVKDTTGPEFGFDSRSGYECEAGYLEIVGAIDSSDLYLLPYSFDSINWTGNSRFDINRQNTTGFVSVTGFVKDSLGNISEQFATYEFIDTGISVNNSNISLSVLTGSYSTGIANIYESFGVTEGNCGTGNLLLEIDSCTGIGYEGNIVEGILTITPRTYYEGAGECDLVITDDDGNNEYISLSFEIDTKASSCALVVPLTQQCTSGVIELSLTGDADISGYSWNLGDEWLTFVDPVSTGVNGLGIYTGYVIDLNGNRSECTGEVTQNIFDNNPFTINVIQATGYECQTITGYVEISTGDSCGKKNLSDFTYDWDSLGTLSSYGTGLTHAGILPITVSVWDLVGNTTGAIVSYVWYDSGITFDDIIVINSVGNSETGFNWKELSQAKDGDCGSDKVFLSGIVDTGTYGICSTGEGDTIIYTPNIESQHEGSDICILEIRDDEYNTGRITITFNDIDTKKPECSIVYDRTCTSGGITLSMNTTGAIEYSWDGIEYSATKTTVVTGNAIYTGYVRDGVGNIGICYTGVNNFDDVAPVVTGAIITGEECTVLSGSIQSSDLGCGSGNLIYNWAGYGNGNGLNFSGYSAAVTGETATIMVVDGAWNSQSAEVIYTWENTNPSLTTSTLTYDTIITGTKVLYEDLIVSMGVKDGACGSDTISKTGDILCTSGTVEWIDNGIQVTPPSKSSGNVTCTVMFVDDELNTVTGYVMYTYDTERPGVQLIGTNLVCMSGNSFVVTGIFTEDVEGFESGDIEYMNGNISNFSGEGSEYTWNVNMVPMVEVSVKIPEGKAHDEAGNLNTESNELTGMYDNVGPIAVSLTQPGAKIYANNATLSRNSTIDSGCADVSGYNWEIYSGSCGVGSPYDAGFIASGNLLEANVDGLVDSGSYCRRVQPVDNFGKSGEWTVGEFSVDLSSIGCKITPVNFECTSGEVEVKLEAATGYTVGEIYLSWVGTGDDTNKDPLYTGLTYSGQTVTGYIYQTVTDKWNVCEYTADNIIDNSKPTITTLSGAEVEECTIGTASIVATDAGCGNTPLIYKWNGNNNFSGDTSYLLWSGKVGEKVVNVQVKDSVGNITGSSVTFKWTNTAITAQDFTGGENVGNSAKTTNWRINSNAIDGACGSGSENVIWSGFISTGDKGECTIDLVNLDNIIYTPKPNQTGDDMCKIQLKDDEDSIVDVEIYREGIDTVAPTCTIDKEPASCVSGSVMLTLAASENLSGVVGGGIEWLIIGDTATGSVDSNMEYEIEITDLAGNTGSCMLKIDYINTGVLAKPTISIQNNSGYTNDDTLDISWPSVSANGECREATGYEVQILSRGVVLQSGITAVNEWSSNTGLDDGEYVVKVWTLDSLGGVSEPGEFNIIIDRQKPTCTIEYSYGEECTSGEVQLTMYPYDDSPYIYSWTGFEDEYMSDSGDTISVAANSGYSCYVKDLAGNTGSSSINVDNISTGVLSYPGNLSIVGGTPTSGNTPEFIWDDPLSNGCRVVTGYEIVLSGTEITDSVSVTGWTVPSDLSDGEYTIKIRTKDNLGGYSEWTGLTFVVDTTAPICSIEVITQECTNSGVEIKLSGDVSDIVEYSWWNGTTGIFLNNITTIVNQNEEYTGYVYDEAGNQGVCTGTLGLDILDQEPISIEVISVVGYECEIITGSVHVSTGNSCGKDQESDFEYLWDGGFTGNSSGIRVDSVSGFTVGVTITDGAGNSGQNTVNYTWGDTGVVLLSGNIHIPSITGDYIITSGDLIDLFGATEGSCGTRNVTVTGVDCSGASYTFAGGEFTIIPNDSLDGLDGYCVFEFRDDEENTVIGTGEFVVDTVVPELSLTGNAICEKGGMPWTITGTWSENVELFELSDIDVTNGIIGDSRLLNENPIYVWSVTSPIEGVGMTTVSVSSGKVVDDAGNSNVEDKSISWNFDNVGPNDVEFDGWQDMIFIREATLKWNDATESGCAGVSGYNYKFVEGENCSNAGISGFKTETGLSVNNLEHGNSYTLCVQPVDTLGNTGNWTSRTFEVDLNSIGCVIEESACSNTGVILTLKPGVGVELSGISLSWTGYDDLQPETQLTKIVTESGLLVTGYIRQVSGDIIKQKECTGIVQNIDNIDPIISSIIVNTGYECTVITGYVELADGGCGSGLETFMYQWDGGDLVYDSSSGIYEGQATGYTIYVTGYDGVTNSIATGIYFEWMDSPISGKNITVENVGMGFGVNWRELSEVSDGACGSGVIEFSGFVNSGSYGTCTTGEGDTIVYVPIDGYIGSDSCTIEVKDDDEQTKKIQINWEGIDREKPSCILSVEELQSCTSGTVKLVLSSDSIDLSGYSFDGEIFGDTSTIGVSATGIYTGYVIDFAGNVSDPCTIEITGGILDLDEPTLQLSDWTGKECEAGSITVTGNDNSCGLSGLYYDWKGLGFADIGNTNEIYSGDVGTRSVNVFVYDGVGHFISGRVTYTWENDPVTGHNFIVENVGTGISVNWYVSGDVSAGACELSGIVATVSGSDTGCEVNGHNITFTPGDNMAGWDSCVIIVSDGDDEDLEIEIIWTGIDTKKPTVELQGGVGEQCTSGDIFTVTGVFSEDVEGVVTGTLMGDYVKIQGFNVVSGDTYEWIVRMKGGTGTVWIDTGAVRDSLGNINERSTILTLGNYDKEGPNSVVLSSPGQGSLSYSNTIPFSWSGVDDNGCAGVSGYELWICEDADCHGVQPEFVQGTEKVESSLPNGIGYWKVISVDKYGNKGAPSEVRDFRINSDNPRCSIVVKDELQCIPSGDVLLILTGDKNIEIINSGGIDWSGEGTYYTGYASENGEISVVVDDGEGHTGKCDVLVSQFDNEGPEIIGKTISVYECQGIGIGIEATYTGCAGISGYSFGPEFGSGISQSYSGLYITSGQIGRTGGINIVQKVTAIDILGHENATGYILVISGVSPTLSSGNYNLGMITGVVNNIDVVDVLGANEGDCGTGDLQVQLSGCVNGIGTLTAGILSIEPADDFEGTGKCELYVSDNELSVVTGYISYSIDTKLPKVELVGTNLACMSGNSFVVTGTFTENVEGFETGNVKVVNGIVSSFVGEGLEYNGIVNMDPNVVVSVKIPAGEVFDEAGNPNIESNELTGMYDNIGPNAVTFTNWQDTGYSINDVLSWDPATYNGCADVSGYNYIFVRGVDCDSNIIVSGFTGGTNISVSNLSDGKQYTLCVQPVDNFGNTGNWSSGTFKVDLHSISCEISESSECSNTGVMLTLTGSVPTDWPLGTISLSWTGYDDIDMVSELLLTGRFTQTGTVTGYVKRSSGTDEKLGSCPREITNLDQESPIIESVVEATGYECEAITGFIYLIDSGCGNTDLKYIWNGGDPIGNSGYSLSYNGEDLNRRYIVYVTGLDGAGNTVNTGVGFTWQNVPVTGHDFTGENVGTGITINWKVLSAAHAGSCDTITATLQNSGSKGSCDINGDYITYTPNNGNTGEDVCEIWLEDDDGSTGSVKVYWNGIDTLPPQCKIVVPQQCVSGNVQIILSGDSSDIATYSRWDMNIGSFGGNKTTGVNATGIYTGYVWDILGNTGVCTGMVMDDVLDQGEISYVVTHASGYECTTITGGVQINTGDGCGNDDFSDFTYSREGGWTGNESGQYLGGTGTKVVNVSITNGAGIIVQTGVTYTWQNVPVTGHDFTGENVGTGITINWKVLSAAHAGSCDTITATLQNDGSKGSCDINGDYITYTPSTNKTGADSCVINVTDGDDEGIEITITWTGIDTYGPTVTLIGGVGPQCTSENTFTVTGVFSEQVAGVTQNTLTGNNVEIQGFNEVSGDTYEWTVKMKGGTGEVWVDTGNITDLLGNEYEGGTGLVLGNYDISAPSPVDLVAPGTGSGFYSSTIIFEWSGSIDEGCAGISGYTLEICTDLGCANVIRSRFTAGTGVTGGSLPNGTGYWRVISTDANGNTGVSDVRRFYIDSTDPHCSIVEQQQCTTGDILLTLTGDKNITIFNSGGIDWNGGGSYYTGYVSENGGVSVIVEDIAGHTGQCDVYVSKQDNVAPTFTFANNSGNECEAGSLIITGVNDTGCALLSENAYKFGTGNWGTATIYSINTQQPRTVSVTGYVRDSLGNYGSIAAIYTINNVGVTGTGFSTGNIGNTARSITLAQFIVASNASEGSCGTGDLSFSGVKIDGNKGHCVISDNILTYIPAEDKTGSDTCSITIKDNENSTKDIVVTFNDIDTLAPQCDWYSVPSGWTSGSSVIIYLTGCDDVLHNTGRTITLNSGYDFEVSDFAGNTGIIHVDYTGFDREAPTFEFNDNSGMFECKTGTLAISGANDTGIGLDVKPYSFDGITWNNGRSIGVYLDRSGGVVVTGYVRDALGNRDIKYATYYFADSMPTATGFTISVLNGIDVNWKELSQAIDGDCGSGPMIAEVTNGGSKGVCSISGDILTYKPNSNLVTGEDLCELSISDDEGNSITGIKVNVTDINNYPYVNLVRPDDGEIISSGNLSLGWSLSGNTNNGLISQYVYRIRSTPSINIEYRTTGLDALIDLNDFRDGQYFWDVYAEFLDGTTGGLSSVYSFNVTRKTSSGGGGGGGGVRLVKDKCPNGDKSDSYYDGTCENDIRTHGSASIDICGVNASNYSTEQKFAYLYAYDYGITTMCPIQNANLDGYLIRSHFAKMISEFAVKVLGIRPEGGKEGCYQFNDIDKLSDELRGFAIMSCELGLMGLESDGVTPSKSFNPGNYVTRAQFGTILSRLLFGDTYNVKDEAGVHNDKGFWYTNHLSALKEYGVMTQIDGNWPNYLERRGLVMIMLERADNYGIFAGKVPAKNGVSALFNL